MAITVFTCSIVINLYHKEVDKINFSLFEKKNFVVLSTQWHHNKVKSEGLDYRLQKKELSCNKIKVWGWA
jgi:hypothetical protein